MSEGRIRNPIFEAVMGNQQNSRQSQFDIFKNTIQGDPEAIVNQLVTSGKMSQELFNDLYAQALSLRGILH